MLNRLIVYVEDSDNDAFLLQHALERTQHKGPLVRLATADDARNYFAQTARGNSPGGLPGLILIDLHLGVESGKELVKYIRGFEAFREVPIITLTSSYAYEDLDKAYETGSNLFLIKPQDFKGWAEMILRIRDYFPPPSG